MAPLLTVDTAKAVEFMTKNKPLVHVPLTKEPHTVRILPPVEEQQLPIERVMPPELTVLYNKEVCEFCEYFLHFVQQEITNPKTEVSVSV